MTTRKWSTRGYLPGDEKGVIDLWKLVFSEGEVERADLTYWKWQFADNPTGFGQIRVAVVGKEIVGHYAVVPVPMQVKGEPVRATLSLDTMTHPDYRRQGMLTTLASELYAELGNDGFAITYGFPNDNSIGPLINKLQWDYVCSLPVYVKPLRPGAIVKRFISRPWLAKIAKPLAELGTVLLSRPAATDEPARAKLCWLESFDERADELWQAVYDRSKIALTRSAAFLNWRYFTNPVRAYRVVAFEEQGQLVAYAVLRCMEQFGLRGGMITDWAGLPGRDDALRAVLSAALEYFSAEGMDVAACLLQGDKRLTKVLKQTGFWPAPKRAFKEWYFCVRVNNEALKAEQVNAAGDWYITFGDTDII